MPSIAFYPLDIRIRTINQQASIVLYGRTPSGERVAIIDQSHTPYFYIVPKGRETAEIEKALYRFTIKVNDHLYSITGIEKKTIKLHEKDVNVLKVYVNNSFGISSIVRAIKERPDIKEFFEHDLPFIQNYMVDKRLSPCTLTYVEGDVLGVRNKHVTLKARSISQTDDELIQNPKVLAFDIEMHSTGVPNPDDDPIIMISFYGDGIKKTFTWKRFETTNESIEFVDGEFELIQAFKKTIQEINPDFLIGYASDIVAFPYIKKRADKYNIAMDISADGSVADISNEETKILGITHIDLYPFISNIIGPQLETDSYRLKDVVREILGETKKSVDIEKLSFVWDKEPNYLEPFCEYTLDDARFIYKLTEKLFPSMFEYLKLTNLQLFDIVRGSFSQFSESFLIKESRFWNQIIPSKSFGEESVHRKSGFIDEPTPGIYKNISHYDFSHLPASIIAYHNVSPGTKNCLCCEEHLPGEKTHFCKKLIGFFPKLIGSMLDRQQRLIKMLSDNFEKSAQQTALLSARLKALSNLTSACARQFSVSSSRWFDSDCAQAIESYRSFYVHSFLETAKQEKISIVCSDFDSVFLKTADKHKAKEFYESLKILEQVKPIYGFYPKAMFVAPQLEKSVKKKYVLLAENGSLKLRGFESTRKNLSTIAKDTQEKVLQMILKEGHLKKAFHFVEEVIQEIKDKKIPLKKTMIYVQLQKELSQYETVAPYVAVAKSMQQKGFNVVPGVIIKYIVSPGEGTISEKSKLPAEAETYDSEYYIHNQIIPAVEKIFEAAGVDFLKVLNANEQSNLSEFID